MHQPVQWKLSVLAAAVAAACALSACGGGGGGTRADPPPTAPPPTQPPPPPPPPPLTVEDPDPAYSLHLSWTGAAAAHAQGLTGAGVRIGIVDSGVNRDHPAMRDGRVVANLTYIDPRSNNLQVDDVVGHGTAVAQIAAGMPFGRWPGGIAPGAEIVSARIISDTPPEDDGSGEGNEVDGALGLAPIHDDLMRHGVRIMNNSWGGLYWTNPSATAEIAAEYRPFIVGHGGLVVFSTGNSGFADPSDTAALPSQAGTGDTRPAADLERGWLAVAALSEDSPSQLAPYSNACGLAMNYCLASPGTVIVTGTDDAPDAPEYWRWSGTSFAAPIVSGAAALVWEAFPYFDNDLVRQTLLGTATDLGDPGVDAEFGHGALDIARAVRGPGRLDWGQVVADFDQVTSVWSNPLSGAGGITKRGTGRLELTGQNVYEGQTRVEGGILASSSDLPGDLHIGPQGSFETSADFLGLARGDIVNQGRLTLLDTVGQRPVGGDYHQLATGTLAFELGSVLSVGGSARIDGGEAHVLGVIEGYALDERERVLTAAGGVSGQFDELSWAQGIFLEATLEYEPNDIWLNIERLDVAAAARRMAAISPAAAASAQRVEAAFDRIDAQRTGVDSGIAEDSIALAGRFQRIGSEQAAKAALESLSGESHSLATTLSFDAIDMGRRALSARLGQLQPGAGAGAWRQALGAGGEGTGIAGGGFQLDGWMLGRDQVLADGLVSGFAFGETRGDGWVGGNRDRSRDRQTAASLYLGRLWADGYVAGSLGAGRFDRDIERMLFDGEDARAGVFSGYSGRYTSLAVEAGRHHRLGEWDLAPYVGADHVQLDNDGFAEWGSSFALRADPATLSRTQATLGLRASRDWRGARLHAWSEWQQTLRADGFDMQASFTGIDSWSSLPLADAAKSGGLIGLGLETWLGRGAHLSLNLDQRFGPRGDERMASLRYVLGF